MRILIVEDEAIIAADLRELLEDLGYDVGSIAASVEEAERELERQSYDLMLVDIVLSGERDGIDLAQLTRRRFDLPLVFITSHADPGTVRRARAVKPEGYLVKPFSREEVFAAVEIALSHAAKGEAAESAQAKEEPSGAQESGGLPAFRLRRVKSYVNQNFGDDLSLDAMAEVAGMSKYHFCRLFRQSAGVTPYQYLLGVRVDRAKRLLQETEDSIGDIAEQVGFNSQSQFNRAFRKLAGTTPAAFRREN